MRILRLSARTVMDNLLLCRIQRLRHLMGKIQNKLDNGILSNQPFFFNVLTPPLSHWLTQVQAENCDSDPRRHPAAFCMDATSHVYSRPKCFFSFLKDNPEAAQKRRHTSNQPAPQSLSPQSKSQHPYRALSAVPFSLAARVY